MSSSLFCIISFCPVDSVESRTRVRGRVSYVARPHKSKRVSQPKLGAPGASVIFAV